MAAANKLMNELAEIVKGDPFLQAAVLAHNIETFVKQAEQRLHERQMQGFWVYDAKPGDIAEIIKQVHLIEGQIRAANDQVYTELFTNFYEAIDAYQRCADSLGAYCRLQKRVQQAKN